MSANIWTQLALICVKALTDLTLFLLLDWLFSQFWIKIRQTIILAWYILHARIIFSCSWYRTAKIWSHTLRSVVANRKFFLVPIIRKCSVRHWCYNISSMFDDYLFFMMMMHWWCTNVCNTQTWYSCPKMHTLLTHSVLTTKQSFLHILRFIFQFLRHEVVATEKSHLVLHKKQQSNTLKYNEYIN